MNLRKIAARLVEARDFIEVGALLCRQVHEVYGIPQTGLVLHAPDGRPLLSVDNMPGVEDAFRLGWFSDHWRLDALVNALFATHAPVIDLDVMTEAQIAELERAANYTGLRVRILVVPILQPIGVIGSLRFGQHEPYSPELLRELTALSTHVSVRLSQLGIGTAPDPVLRRLTPRQLDVAHHAARGLTNAAIGVQLALSENTVKKHLKVIFEELGLANRTELAGLLSRLGPRHDLMPLGVTRVDGLAVTRGLP